MSLHAISIFTPTLRAFQIGIALNGIARSLCGRFYSITNEIRNSVEGAIEKINRYIEENRYQIFFTIAAVYSCLAYPVIFATGFPIGFGSAYAINFFHPERKDDSFCLWSDLAYEGALIESTLGVVSSIGHVFRVYGGPQPSHIEGLVPSVFAGTIAGAYLYSALSLLIKKISGCARFSE